MQFKPYQRWWHEYTMQKTLRNYDKNTLNANIGGRTIVIAVKLGCQCIAMAMTFPYWYEMSRIFFFSFSRSVTHIFCLQLLSIHSTLPFFEFIIIKYKAMTCFKFDTLDESSHQMSDSDMKIWYINDYILLKL